MLHEYWLIFLSRRGDNDVMVGCWKAKEWFPGFGIDLEGMKLALPRCHPSSGCLEFADERKFLSGEGSQIVFNLSHGV